MPPDRKQSPPILSEPPARLDNDYVRTALKSIKEVQAEQARTEAERAGASKMTARLVKVFGTILSAAAIGALTWMWNANQTLNTHSSEITQLSRNPAPPHGHASLASEQRSTQRQVNGLQGAHDALTQRLDENAHAQDEKLEQILNAVRHGNQQRRTWGGN